MLGHSAKCLAPDSLVLKLCSTYFSNPEARHSAGRDVPRNETQLLSPPPAFLRPIARRQQNKQWRRHKTQNTFTCHLSLTEPYISLRRHLPSFKATYATMKAETEVVLAVVAYSFCSGTLVLLNKLILHHLPFPSLVISVQLIAALMFIGAAKYTEKLEVDPIKWVYVKPYLVYTVAFSMGVFCNMKSLSISNVETVIVFRALSPCIVSFLDAIFLGREYPSIRSWSALALIVLGTVGYASFDVKFQTQGLAAYAWPLMYLIVISFEMAYGKMIIRSVDLKTKSGPVLYTNVRYVTLLDYSSLHVVCC
jgi:uncharacterized membrane protein